MVIFSFNVFACDELLVGRLVSFGRAPTTWSFESKEKLLVPSVERILYWFVDSNTGDRSRVEFVKTALSCI